MEKLIPRSRVGKHGAVIACPHCQTKAVVGHLSWSALGCQQCGQMVEKGDWFRIRTEPAANV
jgi:PHP family Zn ribbon phosphoesterase